MNNRCIYKLIVVLVMFLTYANSSKAQSFALKSNILYDISTTLNLGAEIALSDYSTLSVVASYNPWEYEDNAKRKYMLIQPEYRKWFRGVYNGYFFGAQLSYGTYNIGGKLPWWIASFDTFENNRYQGDIYGVGATSGYQWVLSRRFNLELAASLGYANIKYSKYDREVGTSMIEQGRHNYWGITQVGFTLVYYIK